MALDYISFYNTNGEEISVPNLVNQMINLYDLKREIGETRLTDFNEGSEIRNILEAFAILEYARLEEEHEATRISFISTSYGVWLDRIGELPFINLPRVQGSVAQGEVTFTLDSVQSSDITVPAGTVVACSNGGLDFVTLSDCFINAGDLSADVAVECLVDGVEGNVSAGSIDTVSSEFVDSTLVSVSNQDGLDGGADLEGDEDYRSRLLANVQRAGFGTLQYYMDLCEAVTGVHDVLFINASGYTRKCIVNGDVKPTPDSVLLDVLTALTDNSNHVLNHSFTVAKPVYDTEALDITLSVTSEIASADLSEVLTCLFDGGVINGFQVDFEGLKINESISKERIVNTLELIGNVVEVTSIKQSGTEITELVPSTNGVLKLGTLTFTQNEV